eukprot:TRINITY_DN1501_c0_g1_i5.p1 TRINITY_DN1501_c0_g1~~TRINITY_DN1501_c0_g1_i5.p1  ORF type:complete len:136 (-),score=12.74 TRINITY_DN1501_c0_g1_i5:105-512(-)
MRMRLLQLCSALMLMGSSEVTGAGSVWVYGGSWSENSSALKFVDGFGFEYFSSDGKKFIAPEDGNYDIMINGVERATEGTFQKIFLVAQKPHQLSIGQTFEKTIALSKGDTLGIWTMGHSTSGRVSSSLNFLINW